MLTLGLLQISLAAKAQRTGHLLHGNEVWKVLKSLSLFRTLIPITTTIITIIVEQLMDFPPLVTLQIRAIPCGPRAPLHKCSILRLFYYFPLTDSARHCRYSRLFDPLQHFTSVGNSLQYYSKTFNCVKMILLVVQSPATCTMNLRRQVPIVCAC
jgi:hypothetical protein